jgi:hypothetical protein
MVRATMEKTSSSIRAHTSLSDPLLVTNGWDKEMLWPASFLI